MHFEIFYVPENNQFYFPSESRGNKCVDDKTAVKRLAKLAPQYNDNSEAFLFLNKLKKNPLMCMSFEAVQEHQKEQKDSKVVDYNSIYKQMRPLFTIKSLVREDGLRSFYIVNEQRECTPLAYSKIEHLTDSLIGQREVWANLIKFYEDCPELETARKGMPFLVFLKRILDQHYLADASMLIDEEPKRFSWEPADYAFKKFDLDVIQSGPMPTWEEFLQRLDYPEIFKAWVGGLFEPTNNIRQAMWIQGAGNDGKSSVQKALERIFGLKHSYSMKPGDESSKWFSRSVYGKSLVNYADCNSLNLLKCNSIKQLTGGDSTSIEGKGKDSFRGVIYAKLLVTSNKKPLIDPESEADTSRLIMLNVSGLTEASKDAGFENRLVAESSAFLHACQHAFQAHVAPGFNKLILPDTLTEKMIAQCASEIYYVMQEFVEKYIEFAPHYYCEMKRIGPKLKQFTTEEHWMPHDKARWFESDFTTKMNFKGVQPERIQEDGKTITAMIGFRFKGDTGGNLKQLKAA